MFSRPICEIRRNFKVSSDAREHPVGRYVAVAPAVPDCQVEGRTRHEALERLRLTLEEWFKGTEVTSVEVSVPQGDQDTRRNPWLDTAGVFVDDPTLEPMLQQIYAERAAEG
jgi:predicted RNase H-like HicB family nuclease